MASSVVHTQQQQQPKQQLVWQGALGYGSSDAPITAFLVNCSPERLSRPLWPSVHSLRLLSPVSVSSIPPVLLSSMHFHLFLTASDSASQRYINGLVSMLVPRSSVPNAAVYARIESAGSSDPFDTQEQLPPSPYGIVYMEDNRLILHMLNPAPSVIPADTAMSDNELPSLAGEREFLAWHAQQQKLHAQQKTEQAKSRSLKRQPSANTRRKSRMTLADVERFAQGIGDPQPSPLPLTATEPAPDKNAEEQNKNRVKQLIIAALKERQIFRAHKDFATLWSLIYKSCKFAMRDRIGCQALSVGDLKREVEKHTAFYCSK